MYVFLWVFILANIKSIIGQNLKEIIEWNSLDYLFPNSYIRQQALQNGQFVPNNGVPIDIDVDWHKSRIFVTIPRFKSGIPVTFGKLVAAMSENFTPITANFSRGDSLPNYKKYRLIFR